MAITKCTNHFQEALASAQSIAVGNKNPDIETIHLIKALTEQANGTINQLFIELGVNISKLKYTST
jgi:ATP-dependent Clp protease ATP-binding subunit ClpB